jgi:hypothetical protein
MPELVRVKPDDILRIAGEAACDPRTVQTVIHGGGLPLTRARVAAAARRLAIAFPDVDELADHTGAGRIRAT